MTIPRLSRDPALLAVSCAPGVAGRGGGERTGATAKPRFAVAVQPRDGGVAGPVVARRLPGRAGRPAAGQRHGVGLRRASSYRGRLIVNRDAVPAISRVMRRLFALHYPIRLMRPVSAYGADDHRSMAADNTSAFNCRFVSGTSTGHSTPTAGRST